MTPDLVLGVDPGARATGLAVINSTGHLVAHRVLERPSDMGLIEWCRTSTLAGLDIIVTTLGFDVTALTDPMDLRLELRRVLIAIESVVAPSPHLNRRNGTAVINVEALLETAAVFGAFADSPACAVVSVRPAGNGHQPYATYPDELVTDTERRRKGWRLQTAGQSSTMRHARSAYDVATAARMTAVLR